MSRKIPREHTMEAELRRLKAENQRLKRIADKYGAVKEAELGDIAGINFSIQINSNQAANLQRANQIGSDFINNKVVPLIKNYGFLIPENGARKYDIYFNKKKINRGRGPKQGRLHWHIAYTIRWKRHGPDDKSFFNFDFDKLQDIKPSGFYVHVERKRDAYAGNIHYIFNQ